MKFERTRVKDFMIRSPVYVDAWQPVAFARQLMLTHSFSFLPIKVGSRWMLLSEMGMAAYLFGKSKKKRLECLQGSIKNAICQSGETGGLKLEDATTVGPNSDISLLLNENTKPHSLWVVISQRKIVGVLSPFELM